MAPYVPGKRDLTVAVLLQWDGDHGGGGGGVVVTAQSYHHGRR